MPWLRIWRGPLGPAPAPNPSLVSVASTSPPDRPKPVLVNYADFPGTAATHLGWHWGLKVSPGSSACSWATPPVGVCRFRRCQQGPPCLPITVPGLEKGVHPAWGTPSMLDQQPQSSQKGWAKPSVSTPSAQTLFWVFLGGQFFCMFWERFIDLGLLCQPLGFGLILGVVRGPKGSQPYGGQDEEQMWLFCCALAGRLLVLFAFHFLSLHKPKSFHLVSTVADRTQAWRLPEGVGMEGLAPADVPQWGQNPAPQERGGGACRREGSFQAAG